MAGVNYLPNDLSHERRAAIQQEIARLGAEAPYGWGHTLDLGGGLRIDGLLSDNMSDMIVGLKTLYDCLRAPGTLLLESQVAPEADLPYANFGRFVSGMWWEPSPGCVREMLEFVGFDEIAWEPHSFSQRAIFSARKITERQMTFKRGLNYPFADILDARQRIFDRLRPEDEPRTSD